ncbi:7TM chemoreceptor [Cinara cedri]|uniref:Gustatory receptor n=1 Tax=Cinara cedri TaxID=506608 RepID=A0A5E4N9I5_9HEMI|nr:7TM chemoreceptor [Cinara cedri]
MIPKWPRLFWNVFSVMSTDRRHNKWQIVYSVFLMVSSVYSFYSTPRLVCTLEGSCDNSLSTVIKGLFARVVAFTCFMSRLLVMVKGKTLLVRYSANLEKFHAFSPMTRAETVALGRLSSMLVLGCLLLTLPVNTFKLALIYIKSRYVVIDFGLMYVQNISMFCIETHFSVLCFALYQKFVAINRDLTALKIDTVARNKYPFASRTGYEYRRKTNGDGAAVADYNRDILQSLRAGRPMADFAERLKIKHRLVREAVRNLNDLFGFHLGLSLCSLCLYAIFDLYYHLLGLWNIQYQTLVYGWLLQYTARFGSVTILAHLLTKQALKSKVLLTDINNRYLDCNTKEELQLFFNQICSSAIEFTACDFFTLNTHLITSAIVAGTSYLIILLQFDGTSEEDN